MKVSFPRGFSSAITSVRSAVSEGGDVRAILAAAVQLSETANPGGFWGGVPRAIGSSQSCGDGRTRALSGSASALYQWIFNFLGAGVGWTALAYLIRVRGASLLEKAEAVDVAIALLAYAGIAGVLPYLLVTKGFK